MADHIILTEHARLEARRRGLDGATLLEVARRPEQRVEVHRGREVRQSRLADPASGKLHLVRVVVDLGPRADTVVTAYRTSKLSKYWRER